MKINIDRPTDLSSYFSARANPWAHKYQPALWNDRAESACHDVLDRHKRVLLSALSALGLAPVLNTGPVGMMLWENDDIKLATAAGVDASEIAHARRDVNHFLDSVLYSTNCYAYALNIRQGLPPGLKLFPGQLGDASIGRQVIYNGDAAQLIEGCIKDGLKIFDGDPAHDQLPDMFYLAALHIRKGTDQYVSDFHFIRQDRHGGVSHKNGHCYVNNLNYGGAEIRNLTDTVLPEYEHKATFLVPCVVSCPSLSF